MIPFEKKLSSFPPIVCRLLARTGPKGRQRPMSDSEIAVSAILPITYIKALSWMATWDDVRVPQMLRFTKACGVDFDDPLKMRNHVRYLKLRSRFCYLRRDPEWLTKWSPMFDQYVSFLNDKYHVTDQQQNDTDQ